jgi:hypothetical protein
MHHLDAGEEVVEQVLLEQFHLQELVEHGGAGSANSITNSPVTYAGGGGGGV